MNNLEHWLALYQAPGLGIKKAQTLIQQFNNPEAVFSASRAMLQQAGLNHAQIESLKNPDTAFINLNLEWAEAASEHHIIPIEDARYPAQLKSIHDAPLLLFVWGDIDYLQQPQLAIIGSRNPTNVGKRTASEFAEHISNAGITITSGLALGIDGASHAGALKGMAGTIALVAHGLDIVYPAVHQNLARAISEKGAVVSEMPIGTPPHKGLFPKRNRIISGMSLGTLVVEATLKSGSLITAHLALEQGREVFAIPGSIHNPLARGCHRLIRQGAKLVETANDILEELVHVLPEAQISHKRPDSKPIMDQKLDPDHQKLLKCLQHEPRTIDELVDLSGFSAAEVASMLLIMELEGNIVNDGSTYTCIKS